MDEHCWCGHPEADHVDEWCAMDPLLCSCSCYAPCAGPLALLAEREDLDLVCRAFVLNAVAEALDG